ncbi:MAG: hypothetical protein IID17_05770 [Nitrospinae bacterium]|nr:hypothetical protein [Nitrospinota bacterium]
MTVKNKSESIFEEFCNSNNISWDKIPEGAESTPDYRIFLNSQIIFVEVKQIDKDAAFNTANGISSRTVGSHIRKKIEKSRKQAQAGSRIDAPSIMLVFNNLDSFQLFGTEEHDFISAMYGERTVVLRDRQVSDSYHGRNASFHIDKNTSFSAVGLLRQSQERATVRLYENVFAKIPLNFASLPNCMEVVRVEVL